MAARATSSSMPTASRSASPPGARVPSTATACGGSKLGLACAKNPDAAFGSCSWGKFQVLGLHWSKLRYASPYALAFSTVASEAAHYELLARYIEVFGLTDELRALSRDPDDCRAFAQGYNGPAYAVGGYHQKLARAMQ
ncbi:N-acetylmuramidase domain-containing protein [Novosphingobium silvae]